MQAMKKTQRENILNQASFSKPVWDLFEQLAMQHAFNSLKGSKPGEAKDTSSNATWPNYITCLKLSR
jgi:hypothetical protein